MDQSTGGRVAPRGNLRSLFPHAPADEYWLLLDAGGKVPGFTIGVEPPIVVDGQLRMRT
jgi:hypothetical protein